MARRCCVLIVLLVAAWAIRARLASPQPVEYAGSLSGFPTVLSSWRGQDLRLEADVVAAAGVDDYLNRNYRSESGWASLYVGYYRSQSEDDGALGRSLAVHSPMNCLPGAGWQPTKTERIDLDMPSRGSDGSANTVNKVIVEKGLDRQLVLYWYQTFDRVTANEYVRKVFLVTHALRAARTDVALVRIIVPIDPRDANGETRALLLARPFAARVLPEVQKQLFRS
jgi:EpsI family protein